MSHGVCTHPSVKKRVSSRGQGCVHARFVPTLPKGGGFGGLVEALVPRFVIAVSFLVAAQMGGKHVFRRSVQRAILACKHMANFSLEQGNEWFRHCCDEAGESRVKLLHAYLAREGKLARPPRTSARLSHPSTCLPPSALKMPIRMSKRDENALSRGGTIAASSLQAFINCIEELAPLSLVAELVCRSNNFGKLQMLCCR